MTYASISGTPSWILRIGWLWREDDATPRTLGHVGAREAWERLFLEPLPQKLLYADGVYTPNPHWIACYDAGDADFLLDSEGRVYCSSYPGNSAIGMIVGPGVVLSCDQTRSQEVLGP